MAAQQMSLSGHEATPLSLAPALNVHTLSCSHTRAQEEEVIIRNMRGEGIPRIPIGNFSMY